MPSHSELAFEIAIEAGLTSAGGYEKRDATAYDEALPTFLIDSVAATGGHLAPTPLQVIGS